MHHLRGQIPISRGHEHAKHADLYRTKENTEKMTNEVFSYQHTAKLSRTNDQSTSEKHLLAEDPYLIAGLNSDNEKCQNS